MNWDILWATSSQTENLPQGINAFDLKVDITTDAQLLLDALLRDASVQPVHPLNTGSLAVTNNYVLVPAKHFGFTESTRLSIVRDKAFAEGLMHCPYEFAFNARWYYPEQPDEESVLVMTPEVEVSGHPQLFVLAAARGRDFIDTWWGDTGAGDPYELLHPDALMLFQVAP